MLQIVRTEQIAVRLPSDQLATLDGLVDDGTYESRAAAVRAAIDVLIEIDRRHRDDRAIVEGYRRVPPTEVELAAATESLRDAIVEETW